jgi:hypothetical protein
MEKFSLAQKTVICTLLAHRAFRFIEELAFKASEMEDEGRI